MAGLTCPAYKQKPDCGPSRVPATNAPSSLVLHCTLLLLSVCCFLCYHIYAPRMASNPPNPPPPTQPAATPTTNIITALGNAFKSQNGDPLPGEHIAQLLIANMSQLGELAKQGKLTQQQIAQVPTPHASLLCPWSCSALWPRYNRQTTHICCLFWHGLHAHADRLTCSNSSSNTRTSTKSPAPPRPLQPPLPR